MKNEIMIDKKQEDIVWKIIFSTYMEIFNENLSELEKKENIINPNRAIPQISEIHQRIMDDIDEKALEIVYDISKDMFSFEAINERLVKNKCVFRWSSFVVCDSQTKLFENELFGFGDENEYDLLLK